MTTTMRQQRRKQKRSFVDKRVVFSVLLFVALLLSPRTTTVVDAFESPAKASLKAFEVVTFSKVETTTTTKSSLTSSDDDDEKITAVEFTAFGTHFRVNVEQSYKKILKNGSLFVDQLNGNEPKSIDWVNTLELEREKKCFYDGKTVLSSSTAGTKNANNIASGNLCPGGSRAHFSVGANSERISFASPQAALPRTWRRRR